MFHSTNTSSHVTILIITVIRAQISRQVLSEKVTVRLDRDQILRETGPLYNFDRLYIMQPCGILQTAKYQIYSPVILFSPFMFLGGWKSL